jgi:eukaryotic-like serine/threonine-protein kinase
VEASEGKPSAGGEVRDTAKERADALIGRTVGGRYLIQELLAMGGLASVFRARRNADHQEMAIKVLHPEAEGLPELIERFEREAIAGKHIFHPNVVTVHEIAQLDDGSWFLVQDFVRGRTLRDLIDQGPVAPLRAARMARHVAAGLNAAHDMGIVHRDIKPRNLMLVDGPEEKVQIVDFGLAKVPVESLALLDDSSRRSLTEAGVVFGTVAYIAPEAALGMRSIDRRSDLYALGVILYELLAGRHPFTANDSAEMFRQHKQAVPPPIRERSPKVKVPAALEEVVMRLLQKDPDARYPHARALMVALDAVIFRLDADAARAAPAGQGGPWLLARLPRWKPWKLAAGAVGALAVVLAAVAWIVWGQ